MKQNLTSNEQPHYIWKHFAAILTLLYFVTMIILFYLDINKVYEPPLVFSILNTIFLALIPFAISIIAARSYLFSGLNNLLFIGCSMLAFGCGSLLGGWVIGHQNGPDLTVIIHNIGVLLGSIFYFLSSISISKKDISETMSERRKFILGLAYSGMLLLTILIILAAFKNTTSPFFIQGKGPTFLRQSVLGIAVAFYFLSALIYLRSFTKKKISFHYWHFLSVFMITLGLTADLIQKSVGSPISWLGRTGQYIGCIYALIAIFIIFKSARSKGESMQSVVTSLFMDAELSYRTLVETVVDPIISFEQDGKIFQWNSAAEKVFGYRENEALGASVFDLIISEAFIEVFRKEMDNLKLIDTKMKTSRSMELTGKTKDGSIIPLEVSSSTMNVRDKRSFICVFRDITERKMAEEELRTASRNFVSVIESTGDIIAMMDIEYRYILFNTAFHTEFKKIFGVDLKPGDSMPQALAHIPDDLANSIDYWNRALMGEDFTITQQFGNVEMERNWYELHFSPIKDSENKIVGAVHIVRNNTERMQIEVALRESESRLALATKAGKIGVWDWDIENNILLWDESMYFLYGIQKEDFAGAYEAWSQTLHPDDSQFADGEIQAAIRGEREYAIEFRIVKPDGKVKIIQATSQTYRDADGKAVRMIGTNIDITERKRVEDALQAASLYSRNLLETSLDPLVTINLEGEIADVNTATENVTGLSREKLIGSDFADYFTEPEMARAVYMNVFELGQITDYPLAIRHTSGMITEVLYNAAVYRNNQGEVVGVFAAARDITKRKKAEDEINRLNISLEEHVQERTMQLQLSIKELEAFSYTISHDLRAPLRHIDGYVNLLVSSCSDSLNEKGLHYLEAIADSTTQMGVLIDNLLEFSRTGRKELRKETLDMNLAFQEALDILKESVSGRTIKWVIADLLSVQGDYALLRQVWFNLLENAIKYTRQNEDAHIEISSREENGEVIFTVEDNGVGFDMQYADKLFGVFQRLHSLGEFEGTGIGLATVQRIISRHGGRVWAEAEPNKGAKFYFTLPILKENNYD